MRASSLSPVLLAVTFVLAQACTRKDGEVVRERPESFTAAAEAAIGAALTDADWRKANVPALVPGEVGYDAKAFDYLRPLLRELTQQAAVSRRDSFAWDIHLVLDRSAHAYTLPGGQIVLHTGLLHQLDNEAECVGVLAREVALAERGAAMAAYDRAVEDNVLLGDLLLGNETDTELLLGLAATVEYTPAELRAADSLAAALVCPSNYLHEGLTVAVARLPEASAYRMARPTDEDWAGEFAARVEDCVGTDSTYAVRYVEMLRRAVPD